MKKLLISIVALLIASPAWSAQQNISTITTKTSREALRTAVNTELGKVQSNTAELYSLAIAAPWLAQTTAPSITNVFWVDTSGTYPVIKYHNGSAWVAASSGEGGTYTLPTASADTLGGVKVGARLTITNGVLSADVQAGSVSDTAYGVDWNGDTTGAASKNAIYDKIETIAGGTMTYPGAGVPVSTGSAWGTSLAASSFLVGDCTVGPCLDGTSDGGTIIKLWAGTGSYWTALQGGAPAANRSWRLPIAAAPSSGTTYLMNMDEYGQMGFLATNTYLTPSGSAASLTSFPTLNQNTTGSAATLTTARTIGGVSFNGSANINLPGVNATGNQNTSGSAATLTTARTIGGVSFNGSANINLPGVNTSGNQDTSGTAAGLSGTPNVTVGTVSAGAGGATIDPDGDLVAKTVQAGSYTSTAADGARRSILPSNTSITASGGGVVELYNEGGAIKGVENDTEYDVILSRDISGTGVLSALGVNVGSAGAPVLFNGAGGTPTSLALTNALLANSTSLPGTCTVGQLYQDTNADTDGDIYFCRATDTWKAIDDDGGAGGLASTDIDTSAELRTILTDEVGTGAAYFVGGALGTPASVTLTNATGLPLSGVVDSTTEALGAGTVELGAASDTTLARTSAGVITVEGVTVLTTSNSATLSNKSVTAVEVDGSAAGTLTAAQVSGTIVHNRGMGAADVALTLPAATAGYNALFTVGTAQSNKWGVRANTTDKIYLLAADGTIAAGSDNGYARMTAAQVGQVFACWTFQTGSSAWDWQCKAGAIGTSTFSAN